MALLLGDWVPEQTRPVIKISTKNEFVFLNLEGAVLCAESKFSPSVKSGPYLFSENLPKFDGASAVFFSLANNHIKDYGWPAVQATIGQLEANGYNWAGVGETENAARRPCLCTVGGCRYAIFSVSEVQAGRATPMQPGFAALGPWLYQAIARVRSEVDLIVISCHAGNEYLPWPSPILQDLYRSFIDAGADIIHGHHPHVPQGVEAYQGKLICYGLGNFMASPDRYQHNEARHSLGVRIRFTEGQLSWQVEPYCFEPDGDEVIVCPSQNEAFTQYQAMIQAPLANRALLDALWQESALWLYDMYGRDSMGFPATTETRYASNPKRILASLVRRIKRQFPRGAEVRQNQMLWYNLFACLSHRSMMETSMGLLCGEITDVRTAEARQLVSAWLPKILGYDE